MILKKNLKDILIDHFDESEDQNLHLSGVKTIHPSLRSPYIALEKLLKSNDLKGKKVLDYCCGSGNFSIYPAKLGAEVTGVDFSEKSIEKAKIRALNFKVENLCNFLSADVEEIDSFEGGFDLIFIIDSLLYLDLKKTFMKFFKLLNDDGELIIIEGLGNNPIFNLNRRKNINNYASGYETVLAKKTLKEIYDGFDKIFFIEKENYFGFFISVIYFLEKKFKIRINSHFFLFLDNKLTKLPFMRKYFFRCFLNLKKIK